MRCAYLAWNSSVRLSKSWQFLASPSFRPGRFVTSPLPSQLRYNFCTLISQFCNRIRPQLGRQDFQVDWLASGVNGLLLAPHRESLIRFPQTPRG